MFETHNKKRVYWLIDTYLAGTIDTETFDEEYHKSFNLGVEPDTLSEVERGWLCQLSDAIGRYSTHKTDHEANPGFHYTEEEVRAKAAEVRKKLADYWPPELTK